MDAGRQRIFFILSSSPAPGPESPVGVCCVYPGSCRVGGRETCRASPGRWEQAGSFAQALRPAPGVKRSPSRGESRIWGSAPGGNWGCSAPRCNELNRPRDGCFGALSSARVRAAPCTQPPALPPMGTGASTLHLGGPGGVAGPAASSLLHSLELFLNQTNVGAELPFFSAFLRPGRRLQGRACELARAWARVLAGSRSAWQAGLARRGSLRGLAGVCIAGVPGPSPSLPVPSRPVPSGVWVALAVGASLCIPAGTCRVGGRAAAARRCCRCAVALSGPGRGVAPESVCAGVSGRGGAPGSAVKPGAVRGCECLVPAAPPAPALLAISPFHRR